MTFMDRFTSVRDDVRGAFVGYAGRMTQASVCKMQNTIAQKDRLTDHVIASIARQSSSEASKYLNTNK